MNTYPEIDTLLFLEQGSKVLLARKGRKVGAGKLNGYGGKPDPGESLPEAACRETKQETGNGIICKPEDLELRACIDFYYAENDTDIPDHRVYMYVTSVFTGTAHETEEMKDPQWYERDSIPYSDMLPADRLFVPKILAGETFTGTVSFLPNFSGVKEAIFTPMDVEAFEI